MSDRFFVSTRKGLFSFVRAGGKWRQERLSFLGDAVSLALHDAESSTTWAALGLGHFGVKLRRSRDLGATWEDLPAPAFPPEPEGVKETLPDGKPWPWRVEQIWSLERGAGKDDLLCGTVGGGLFRSKDGGASWALVRSMWDHPKRKEWFGGGAEMPGIHSICWTSNQILAGISCGGVWVSHDDAATWELGTGMFAEYMPPPRREDPAIQDPHRLAQCKADPKRVWCQHHNGVFRSDDAGRTWTSIPSVVPSVFGFAVAAHPRDPDTAWLIPAVKDEKRVPVDAKVVVSRTRDAGKTWQPLDRGLPSPAWDIAFRHALDVDASGDRLAFGTTTGALFVSEDGGDAWTCLSAHLPPIYAVRFA